MYGRHPQTQERIQLSQKMRWVFGQSAKKSAILCLFLCSIGCGFGLHPFFYKKNLKIILPLTDFGLSSVPQGQGQETWESSPYPVKVDQRFSLMIMINTWFRATGWILHFPISFSPCWCNFMVKKSQCDLKSWNSLGWSILDNPAK